MRYTFSDYEAVTQERRASVEGMLQNRILAQEAAEARRGQTEAARRRRLCLVRSLVHEVLPNGVANLIADPCVPCGAPTVAA